VVVDVVVAAAAAAVADVIDASSGQEMNFEQR